MRQYPAALASASTLVIGVGNPILGDDGIGWRVAEEVEKQIAGRATGVAVECAALGGLSLMERMIGYRRVVLVDALTTGRAPVGTVSCFLLGQLPGQEPAHGGSPHDVSLQTALKLGRKLGADLPDHIWVVGVEAEQVYEFSQALTPEVAGALPRAAQGVVGALGLSQTAEDPAVPWPLERELLLAAG